jgi:hypothetical protein
MTDQNHECETVEAALTQVPLKLQSTFLSCQAQFPCLVGSVLDYLVFGLEGFAVFGGCFSLDFFFFTCVFSLLVLFPRHCFLCWCFLGCFFLFFLCFSGVFTSLEFFSSAGVFLLEVFEC